MDWSRSVGTVPISAPGGRRSSSVLISVGERDGSQRIVRLEKVREGWRNGVSACVSVGVGGKRGDGQVPSNGIIFLSGSPGIGSPDSAAPARSKSQLASKVVRWL